MPTHRYPLADGRDLEIIDPISEGRARVFLEGELLGEYTIHELKTPATFVLADGSQILVHVVSSIPLFRTFDVRHNGRPLPRSAGDPAWSRRTVIELLLFSAMTHLSLQLIRSELDYANAILLLMALVTAAAVWQRLPHAGKAAQLFMFLQCAYACLGENGSINIDIGSFGLYVWMRHAAHAMDAPVREYTPEHSPRMPRVTLT